MSGHHLASLFLILLFPASAVADVIDVLAIADGDAAVVGSSGVFLDTTSSNVRSLDFSIIDQRGLFEFDLSSLVGGTVDSAQLALTTFGDISRSGGNTLNIDYLAYAGNGVIESADFARSAQQIGSLSVLETSAGGPASGSVLTIELDTALVQQIVDSGGILGIRSQMTSPNSLLDVFSLESSAAIRPTLLLNISSVPEPSSGALVLLTGFGLAFRRKRCEPS